MSNKKVKDISFVLKKINTNKYYKSNPKYFIDLYNLVISNKNKYCQIICANGIRENSISRKYKHLKQWIYSIVPSVIFDYDMKIKVYWILDGIEDFPTCQICNSQENYKKMRKISIFKPYPKRGCTRRCIWKQITNDPATKKKNKETRLRRYGNENYVNIEKQKQTIANFSEEKKNNIQKKKEKTYLKNYGATSYFASESGKEHIKQKCLENYGVDNPAKSPIIQAKHQSHMKEIVDKRNATKRKNGTFNSSEMENRAYNMLKCIFPKIQRQYKSEEYPYCADFYDPDQPNVRFEFQGSWTHGGYPFNENSSKDQLRLMQMIIKNTKYYNTAIKTWIIRDVNKRKIAIKNGIQLIEFWTINDVEKYIQQYLKKVYFSI